MKNQLKVIGQVLWNKAQEEIAGPLAYTVDAILDDNGQLWILEVNSNPFIHPDLYPIMVKTIAKQRKNVRVVEPVAAELH